MFRKLYICLVIFTSTPALAGITTGYGSVSVRDSRIAGAPFDYEYCLGIQADKYIDIFDSKVERESGVKYYGLYAKSHKLYVYKPITSLYAELHIDEENDIKQFALNQQIFDLVDILVLEVGGLWREEGFSATVKGIVNFDTPFAVTNYSYMTNLSGYFLSRLKLSWRMTADSFYIEPYISVIHTPDNRERQAKLVIGLSL